LFEATKVANQNLGEKKINKIAGCIWVEEKILTFVKDKVKLECYNN
jgi:hypothetical protein